MPRRRNRINWLYDNDLQQFSTPSGQVVTLQQIAQLLQDQVTCHHDFAGPWMGWRMRQNRLIPPGATFRTTNITTENIRAFNRWLASYQGEQAQLPLDMSRPASLPSNPSDTASLECTAPTPPANLPPELPTEPMEVEHSPRRRAQVLDLTAYRLRVHAR